MKERQRGREANALRVLVIFASGGGASEGYKQVRGAKVVAAVELDGDAASVYAANHEHPVFQLDLNDWVRVSAELEKHGPFDVVQWSPACQLHLQCNAFKQKRICERRLCWRRHV